MSIDRREDAGDFYPGGKVISTQPVATGGDVKHSDFDGVEPLPERFNDDDVRTKINTVINALKGASAAVVVMLLGATAFGAGVTVQTAPKGRIYNDEQIVTNVVFDATGLATTTNVYTKAETEAKIVELAPAPGDYVSVSNKAMSSLQIDDFPDYFPYYLEDGAWDLFNDWLWDMFGQFNEDYPNQWFYGVNENFAWTNRNFLIHLYSGYKDQGFVISAYDDQILRVTEGEVRIKTPLEVLGGIYAIPDARRDNIWDLHAVTQLLFPTNRWYLGWFDRWIDPLAIVQTATLADATNKLSSSLSSQLFLSSQAATNYTDKAVGLISALIPAQASTTNQLADKQFVNSSIATSTANFCGTCYMSDDAMFELWLLGIESAHDNDYVFWQTEDDAGDTVFKRYKYVEDPSGLSEEALAGHWLFEYDLNNSSFTAVQWAAINSGVTSETIGSTAAALESLRTGKADDNAVVKLSGDQMIFGDKTFQGNTQFDGLISGGTSSGPIPRWQLGDDDLGGYLRFTRYLELIPSTTTLRPDIGDADWQDHTILLPTKSGTAALTSDIPDVSGKADATNVYTKAEMDAQLGRRGVDIPAGRTDVDAHGCVHNAPVELGLGAKATVDLSGLSSNAIVRSVSTAIGPGADASNPDNPSMQQGIAVGNQARAKGTNAIAIGAGVRHEDEDDLTGDNAYAGANEAIAGGYSAKATASQAVAWGSRARAHAPGAWQLGEGVNSNRNTLAFRDYQLLGEDGQVPYERVAGAVAQAGVEFEAAVSNAVRRILAGGNMTLVCDGSEGEQILEPKVAGLSEVQFLTNTNGVHEASTLGYLDPPPQAARNYDVLISAIPEPGWMGTNGWETVALENRLLVGFTELPPQYDVSMHVDESCGFQRSGRTVSITNAPTIVKVREVSTNKVLVVVKPYRLEDL